MRRAGSLVAVYVGLASAWIVASSALAGSSENTTSVEIAKGLAFVAVTAGLLLGLLLAHQRATASTARRLRDLIESAGDITYRYRVRPTPGFEYVSDGVTALVGLTPEDHYAHPDLPMRIVHPDDRLRVVELSEERRTTEPPVIRWVNADGGIIHTRHDLRSVRDRKGRVVAIEGRVRDVTDDQRDQAGSEVGEAILAWLHDGVDRATIGERTCERLVALMEVEIAWIGVPLDDGSVRAVAAAGDRPYVESLEVRWDGGPLASGPTGWAIRERRPVCMNPTHPAYGPWRQRAAEAGLTASLAAPIVWHDVVLGVLNVYSRFGDPFDAAHIARFDHIAHRLALAFAAGPGSELGSPDRGVPASVAGGPAGAIDVAAALAEDRLEPFWQPQVDAQTGRVVALEALLRMRHGDQILLPAAVLPRAEAAGIMVAVGRTIRRKALARGAPWLARGLDRLCCNVGVGEITEPGFTAEIRSLLAAHGIRPEQLELEVVETAPLDGRAISVVAELDRLGVRIAVDDYGSGWASLGHLLDLPASTLKIDRVFVRDLGASPRVAALVTSTIQLGRTLGLTTVAEGVETLEQAEILRALGCELLQGFRFSPPVPTDEVDALLAARLC